VAFDFSAVGKSYRRALGDKTIEGGRTSVTAIVSPSAVIGR
jgi:hypothetical protein